MLTFIAYALLLVGASLLALSFLPIRATLSHLPPGPVRRNWMILIGLIGFFILGYVAFGVFSLNKAFTGADIIVPLIFFFGSIFVWLSSYLSLQTARDVRKVTIVEQDIATDELTGIFNKRYIERRLNEEVARSQKFAMPFAVLLIDLDHFAQINEFYGRQVGDQVLVKISQKVMNTIRANDVVARYGGDEFMVIASNTNPTGAYQISDLLRQEIEELDIPLTDELGKQVEIRLTVSIGVINLNRAASNSVNIISCAEQAVQLAKQEGGNCVMMKDGCQLA